MSLPYLHSNSKVQKEAQRGFGLIELMVSISIMALVTALVFVRQDSFNGAVLLRSQAYEIALAARDVQQSAISATGVGGEFRARFGVKFNETTALNTRYDIFRDINGNGNVDVNESFGQQGSIDRRFEIRDVRVFGDTLTGSWVSVVYERPNFDALFFDIDGPLTSATRVEIDIARQGVTGVGPGVVRTVEFTRTGQISVKDS